MILDKINTKFTNRKDLKCLFIFDPNGEHQETLADATEGLIIIDVDHKYFDAKIQVSNLIREGKKVILYHRYEKPKSLYPLQGYLLTNDELRMDDVAHFMEEYALPSHLSRLAERYMPFFTKTNRSKLAKILKPETFTEENIQRGLISIALDMHTVADKDVCIIRGFVLALDDKSLNQAIKRLDKAKLSSLYLSWINKEFDLDHDELTKNIFIAAIDKLKYLMLTFDQKTQSEYDTYTQLKVTSTVTKNRMQALLQVWVDHRDMSKYIVAALDKLGSKIEEKKIIDWYGFDTEYSYATPLLSECIYNKLIGLMSEAIESSDYIQLEDLKIPITTLHADDSSMEFVANFIHHTSAFLVAVSNNEFIYISKLEDILAHYEDKGYMPDTHYRNLMNAYGQLSETWKLKFNALFTSIHKLYYDHQKRQNIHWQDKMNQISFDYRAIDYPKQYNFYNDEIREVKTAVIISDAFRYEVAVELSELLLKDSKTEVELKGALASIPSFTQMGMSNLLPHSQIGLDIEKEDFKLSIDGIATVSTNREKILRKTKENSLTIDYSKISKMNTDEIDLLFRSHSLVYIYHNHVDATGDKRELEGYTFASCEQAIQDIFSIIKKLNSSNIYHQFVTADHGFIYNHRVVEDIDKEDMPSTGTRYMKDSRCCIVDKSDGHKTGYAFPLRNTTNIDTDLTVLLPKAINRYKRRGNIGLRFVHGGGSLQELIVPVLKYYRKSASKRAKVGFVRIDNTTKITSSLKVSILQENAINNVIQPRSITVGLYDIQNELVSNLIELQLDKNEVKPSERTFTNILTLSAKGSTKSFVYLRAMDIENNLDPIINEKILITNLTEIDDF